jgi:catechol 2,3-dioxygenase-like lactoylglutathione lyase family enzyme
MILNHLDLQVSEVQAAVLFFERFFDLSLQTSRTSPALAILSDDRGFVLVLQRKKRAEDRYPDGFHLGFLVEDVATVERMHARLREGGAHVSDLETNNRGTMIYCRAPDDIVVEVSCRRR